MTDLPILPIRITQMIRELHRRGYESLYLYAGMSPSGLYWRFMIGVIDETNLWPGNQRLVNASMGSDYKPEWSEADASATQLADDFEKYFYAALIPAKKPQPEFVKWFDNLVTMAGENLLVFYADYDAPHQKFLEDAPYYRN